MSYIGNNLQVAFPSYTKIDDISGSFNGSTTSFPLRVNGAAPVPLPINSQQCLISVNAVVQKPDDTGAEGFRLSGGNIIFSSAPTAGWKFFGIILAGADYVNVGVKYPDGSLAAPSITFDSDLDTGFYSYGANQIGVSCGGVLSTVFTSTGYGFGAGTAAAPGLFVTGDTNTGLYSPGADQLSISTGGTERLRVDGTGQLEAVSLGSAAAPTFSFTTDPNTGIYSPGADQLSIATGGTERLRVDSAGQIGAISLGTAAAPTFSFTTDPNTGIYSPGADQIGIATGGTGRLTIDASGNATFGSNVTLNAQGDLRFADADSSNWVAFQAPSTVSSNVTWTLPSSDGSSGQVLRTDGAGLLSWITPGGGKVLQCQSYEITGTYSATSSSSLQQSVITGLITPSSATSRILVIASFITTIYSVNGSRITLYRNDSVDLSAAGAFTVPWYSVNGNYATFPTVVLHLDQPGTTSQTRYRIYFNSQSGNTTYINYQPQWYGVPSGTMTLLEIAA